MQPVQLFDLAARQAQWLSVRQTAVAGNIANVNTPGYVSVDVEPFEKVLAGKRTPVAPTHPGHIAIGASAGSPAVRQDRDVSMTGSGTSVVLEQELVKAGEVKHAFEMNTAIVKSFHRMLMLASK